MADTKISVAQALLVFVFSVDVHIDVAWIVALVLVCFVIVVPALFFKKETAYKRLLHLLEAVVKALSILMKPLGK